MSNFIKMPKQQTISNSATVIDVLLATTGNNKVVSLAPDGTVQATYTTDIYRLGEVAVLGSEIIVIARY